MKKIVLIFCVAALTAFGVNAQGTWKSTGTEAAIDPTTAIVTGITGLVVMHNDAGGGVSGHADTGTNVTYDGITWDSPGFLQGITNGMYFAMSPSSDGTIEVAVKMGSNKPTFVAETADVIATVAAQVITAADKAPISKISNPTFPAVYDTYTGTTNTWGDSYIPIVPSSDPNSEYLVMAFPVKGGMTYIVGCTGSKLMLRGINYVTSGAGIIVPALNTSKDVKSEEYFDLTGKKVTGELKKAVLIKKTTYIDGTTSNTKIVNFQK